MATKASEAARLSFMFPGRAARYGWGAASLTNRAVANLSTCGRPVNNVSHNRCADGALTWRHVWTVTDQAPQQSTFACEKFHKVLSLAANDGARGRQRGPRTGDQSGSDGHFRA